jgi:hypothetical protein
MGPKSENISLHTKGGERDEERENLYNAFCAQIYFVFTVLSNLA